MESHEGANAHLHMRRSWEDERREKLCRVTEGKIGPSICLRVTSPLHDVQSATVIDAKIYCNAIFLFLFSNLIIKEGVKN